MYYISELNEIESVILSFKSKYANECGIILLVYTRAEYKLKDYSSIADKYDVMCCGCIGIYDTKSILFGYSSLISNSIFVCNNLSLISSLLLSNISFLSFLCFNKLFYNNKLNMYNILLNKYNILSLLQFNNKYIENNICMNTSFYHIYQLSNFFIN